MRLARDVEAGLHLCLVLAALPEGESLAASDLAAFHDLPPAATAKLLSSLAARGVLSTSEGRRGGYRLARPATGVTVAEIVGALDSGEKAFVCREVRRRGPCAGKAGAYRAPCAIAAVMAQAESAWWDALASTTLEDLKGRVSAQVNGDVQRQSTRWLAERTRP